MDAPSFDGRDLLRGDSGLALYGKGRTQRHRPRALRRDQHQSAAVESAVGIVVAEIAREVGEDVERGLRERDIFRHRVVRADDARGLRCRSSAELAALDEQYPSRIEAREVAGDRSADDAAA